MTNVAAGAGAAPTMCKLPNVKDWQQPLLKMSWSWWSPLLTNEQEELPLKPINRHRERAARRESENTAKDVRNIEESGMPRAASSSCRCSIEKREIE